MKNLIERIERQNDPNHVESQTEGAAEGYPNMSDDELVRARDAAKASGDYVKVDAYNLDIARRELGI